MNDRPVLTFVKKFRVDKLVGENWSFYAHVRHREYAEQVATWLRETGYTVRISEEHSGDVQGITLEPLAPVIRLD